jgi:hypothetical protein
MKLSGFPEGHVDFSHSLLIVSLPSRMLGPSIFRTSLLSYKEARSFYSSSIPTYV